MHFEVKYSFSCYFLNQIKSMIDYVILDKKKLDKKRVVFSRYEFSNF